jgi:hypothetical protein
MDHNIRHVVSEGDFVTGLLEVQPVAEHQQRAQAPDPIADRKNVEIRQHVRQV